MIAMGELEHTEKSTSPRSTTLGMVVAERLYAGLMVDSALSGTLHQAPKGDVPHDPEDDDALVELHTDALVEAICELTMEIVGPGISELTGLGIALPGLIRNGVVEEAPNLPQLKGVRIGELVSQSLASKGLRTPVFATNDADAFAAGLAAKSGKLDRHLRVWTLGTGIGYGTYPFTDGVWEGGHTVVTLDDRENFCGCGGRGHLEGIMGHRAMRLRFLDLEPEEVFANATRREHPDTRCVEFRNLWHKALAAATASSIHVSGAGKFYFTGYNVRFLDLNLLRQYLHDMVKMSPLQSYQLEIVPDDQVTRVIGAGIMAEQVTRC